AWLGPGTGFDYENAHVRLYGDGTKPISFISLADVAGFAVACVDNPAARDRVLELGGPEPVSPLDAVRAFEEVAGRSFEVEHLPVEAIEGMREGRRAPWRKASRRSCCALRAGTRSRWMRRCASSHSGSPLSETTHS